MMLEDPEGRGLSLQISDEQAHHPVRVHLDLYTQDQASQVDRLVGLETSRVENWPYPTAADFRA